MATITKIEHINNPNILNYISFACINGLTKIKQYGEVFLEELDGKKGKVDFLAEEESQQQILDQSLQYIQNAEGLCIRTKTILQSLNLKNIEKQPYEKQEVVKIIDENLTEVCTIGAINKNLIELLVLFKIVKFGICSK